METFLSIYSDDVADLATKYHNRALNDLELTSIRSLIAYVAHEQGASGATVAAMVDARFGADGMNQLHRKDYNEVVRFLVDLNIKETLN
jgi:hypothetical protein